MKKLIIACCAVLAIGCGMMAGGWAAGGQLYGSYYDGELHPVSETVRDAVRVFDRLHFHTWWDGDGWIDDIVDDTLDDIDTGWVDSWLEQRQETIDTPYTIPMANIDQIQNLDLTFRSGAGNTATITSGDNYTLDGDFFVTASALNGRTWELEVVANEGGVTLTLPADQQSYRSIAVHIPDGVALDIQSTLSAAEIEIDAEAGTVDAEMLSAGSLDLSVSDGFLFAFIDHAAAEYHIEGKTSQGPFLLNDTELIGPGVRETRYDNRRDIQNPLYELDVKVAGSGRIGLSTLY
ncbi:MAG: hypothetical protein KH295_01205 [Clostridiaceae bacterium]|nr:hypothetical protein [Clostridiaceae bacterium]